MAGATSLDPLRAEAADFAFARKPDRFQAWLRIPLPRRCTDPRFEVRRASPSDFEAIYDLVDEVFGSRRPRALFDWLYRRNPTGTARCWITIEKASGQVVGTVASWPWPAAQGARPLEGVQSGDAAIAPHWQRRGIPELRRSLSTAHPWYRVGIGFSWPNEKTMGRQRKAGRRARILGPIPSDVVHLGRTNLRALLRPWSTDALARRGVGVEEVRRFDSAFDEVTRRCMAWRGFWFPHDARFLNWRYCDHPTRQYLALAALSHHELVAYCVLGLEGRRATLMEFAAPRAPRAIPEALLRGALSAARRAGCRRLAFFSGPGWPHRELYREIGFAERASRRCLLITREGEPGFDRLENWQLVPGDSDTL